MQNPFEIIKIAGDESLIWVEAADSLRAAKVQVWELLFGSPGEYIVFNRETKQLVVHFSARAATPELATLAPDSSSPFDTALG